ncbi:MAG: hypothetical protein MZV70_56175 [Desulfobacterales bacterium]|nr:hypothetical protein [Desulfobacterales bacterium]
MKRNSPGWSSQPCAAARARPSYRSASSRRCAGRGHSVAPFKKGPDYIDAGWLALAAGRPCYNLDTFLLDADLIRRSFCFHAPPSTWPSSKATAASTTGSISTAPPAPPNWRNC